MALKPKSELVRRFIIDHVDGHPHDITRLTCDKFGISRQAVNRHLTILIEDEVIECTGKTKDRTYRLRKRFAERGLCLSKQQCDEYTEWRDHVEPTLSDFPENVCRICNHGFTEILNNVIEHSEGSEATYTITCSATTIQILILDDGIGIFEKIRRRFELDDHQQAVIELAKGKLTTDQRRHSGQGIFFTSRMFDKFIITSGDLLYGHTLSTHEWVLVNRTETQEGTRVLMEISTVSERTCKQVFDEYSDLNSGNYDFSKTCFPLSLATFGQEYLVSRSQAKRVLARFEEFKEVILDFEGIDSIGQAFADEIFRVYWYEHPGVAILPWNACPEVEQMISRAIAARGEA